MKNVYKAPQWVLDKLDSLEINTISTTETCDENVDTLIKLIDINELQDDFPVISEIKWCQNVPKTIPKLRNKTFQSALSNKKIRQSWYVNYKTSDT